MSGLLVQRLADLNLIRDPASAGTKTLVISRHRKATKKYFSADDVVLHRRGTLQRRSSTDGTKTNLGSIDVVLHRRGRSLLTNTFAREAWDGDPNRKRTTTLFTAKYGKNGINVQNINGIHLPSPGNTINLSYKKCLKMSGAQVNGIVNTLHDLTSDEQTNGLSDEDQPSDMRSPSVSLDHFVSPIELMVSSEEATAVDVNSIQNSLESESQEHSLSDTNFGEDLSVDFQDVNVSRDKSIEDISMRTDCEDVNSMCDSLLVDTSCHSTNLTNSSENISDSSNESDVFHNNNNNSLSMARTTEGDGSDKNDNPESPSDMNVSLSDNVGQVSPKKPITILRTKKKKSSAYSICEKRIGKAVKIGAAYRECRLRERSHDFVTPYTDEAVENANGLENENNIIPGSIGEY